MSGAGVSKEAMDKVQLDPAYRSVFPSFARALCAASCLGGHCFSKLMLILYALLLHVAAQGCLCAFAAAAQQVQVVLLYLLCFCTLAHSPADATRCTHRGSAQSCVTGGSRCLFLVLPHRRSPLVPALSYEKCEYELYIERVKEFAKLRKQQLLVSKSKVYCPTTPSLRLRSSRRSLPPNDAPSIAAHTLRSFSTPRAGLLSCICLLNNAACMPTSCSPHLAFTRCRPRTSCRPRLRQHLCLWQCAPAGGGGTV
jgi:hypothetical protein